MKNRIYDLKINRADFLLGIDPENVMISFKADRGSRFALSLFSEGEKRATYQIQPENSIGYYPDFPFSHGTEYTVAVENENGDSASLTFLTAPEKLGDWLVTDKNHPVFRKTFDLPQGSDGGFVSLTALGVYVVYLNGKRISDRILPPGMNDYDDHVRFQTYRLTGLRRTGNVLDVFVGNGWYKGRFGIDGHGDCTWGDKYLLNARICFDGADDDIVTDADWQVSEGYVTASGIYDGEVRDDTRTLCFEPAVPGEPHLHLVPETVAGIRCFETRRGVLADTSSGETVLDFGQNASGYVRFRNRLPRGARISMQYGEILQDGRFYRDNLRSAKATFEYVSDGEEKDVEPFFTYFGFRYVKIVCDVPIDADDFTACYASSAMTDTLRVQTDNEKLNRLLENVRWGARSNFWDIPTDCPQRDERLGWTADTQVFAPTASYLYETYSFYKKYVRDLEYDQKTYYDGDFPMYSPSLKGDTGHGGAVWADAGVLIPWELYLAYGDKKLLGDHYPSVKRYVDLLIAGDRERGDNHILKAPFTFGDWLAQDGLCEQSLKGGTDDDFIRSAYYYRSVCILAQMAHILGKEEAAEYDALSSDILVAVRSEYFTPSGRVALDTQTAYVLTLAFGLAENTEKVVSQFRDRLRRDIYRIKCGFVGAPMMIQTLYAFGMDEEAERILFCENNPGWLNEVNLGATTIWERWNSVDETGHITGIFMNSLNHYAYGAVAQGIYSDLCGLARGDVAWRSAVVRPALSYRVRQSSISYDSVYGQYSVAYSYEGTHMKFSLTVPHGCTASVLLPNSGKPEFRVGEGSYTYEYEMDKDLLHPFSEHTRMCDLLTNAEAAQVMQECLPFTYGMVTGENREFMVLSVFDMQWLPMYGVTRDGYERFAERIRGVKG